MDKFIKENKDLYNKLKNNKPYHIQEEYSTCGQEDTLIEQYYKIDNDHIKWNFWKRKGKEDLECCCIVNTTKNLFWSFYHNCWISYGGQ